jgi:hypothetical protein
MATTSTAPTVRAALVALLAARAGLAGVQITHVWPGDAADTQEAMWLGRTHSGADQYVELRAGRKPRDEEYTVDLYIWVADPTQWGAASETRAFALMAEVENMVADDPTLGGGVGITSALVASWEQDSGAIDPAGVGTQIRIGIDVEACLT